MAYLVLAYPEITSDDFDRTQNYRRNNDKLYYKVVDPHFTIVFPVFDIDFVPHIGIGNSRDKYLCKKMVDECNKKDFSISGKITHLTVVNYENDTVTKIEEIELEGIKYAL